MSDGFDQRPSYPTNILMTNRIVWAALLMGQLVFLGVVVFVLLPARHEPPAQRPLFDWVNLALLLTAVPATYFIRRLTFNQGRTTGGIRPSAFATGNIIFWAGCEGVSFFGIIVILLNGTLSPTIAIVAVAMVLQVLTFPTAWKMSG